MKKEMTLRELTDALTLRDMIKRENEKNFRDIFFLNPISMTITKIDGTLVKVNEALTRVSGYTKDDLYGKTVEEIGFYSNPQDRVELIRDLQKDGHSMNRSIIFVGKDGRLIPSTMSSKIIKILGEAHILSAIVDDSWRIK
jgi:PAS domain S-box-containing protein